MSTTDARGHKIPEGTDPASRQSLLDLSLSIPSVATAGSLSAANEHVARLRQAGITATADAPVIVWRSDVNVLTAWDGKNWIINRGIKVTAPYNTLPVGRQLIIAMGSKVVRTDNSGKAVLDYGQAFEYVIAPMIATGDGIAAPFVSRGQWGNQRGCDVFAYYANGQPIKNTDVRVNYLVIGW